MTKDAVTLAGVADELYGLDPGSFTAARKARAKEARAAGDRELAAAIGQLAKPTAAAWLANGLARSRTSAIEELTGLGAELRRAQGSGERAEMRRLVEQRRALIGDLVRTASTSAHEGGHSFGSAVERQLEEVLEAAVADEALGRALREGRLTEPFRFVGFGEAADSLADSVAGPVGQTKPKTTRETGPDTAAAKAEAERQKEVERRNAREALDEIEASVEKARARLEAAEERLERASKLMKEAEAEKAASTEALRQARQRLGPARRRLKKRGD